MSEITNINQLDLRYLFIRRLFALEIYRKSRTHKRKDFPNETPSRKHQVTAGIIYRYLDRYFEKHSCGLYFAPFDVRLSISKNQPMTIQFFRLCNMIYV